MSHCPKRDFVSAEIARVPSGGLQSLGTLDLWCDRGDDGAGQFLLYREDVLQHAVVALRPNVVAGQCVDELGGHTNPIRRLADAPFQHVSDAEFSADLADIWRFAL